MRFAIADPMPGVPLAQIAALPLRAQAWLARVSGDPTFPDDRSVQVVGAVHFLEGLEYHYQSYMAHIRATDAYFSHVSAHTASLASAESAGSVAFPVPTESERPHVDALDHEAIAYLNRLGQFYYFARALDKADQLRRASDLMSFRNKHVAHRSIDSPRGEDAAHLRMQAMAFGFYRITLNGVVKFQILDDGKYKEFCMPEDHPVLMKEATEMLLSIHQPAGAV